MAEGFNHLTYRDREAILAMDSSLAVVIAKMSHEQQRELADHLVLGKSFDEAIAGMEHLVERREWT